jgi:hypothetical protein
VKEIDVVADAFNLIDAKYSTLIEAFFDRIATQRKVNEPAYDMACFEALLTMSNDENASPGIFYILLKLAF